MDILLIKVRRDHRILSSCKKQTIEVFLLIFKYSGRHSHLKKCDSAEKQHQISIAWNSMPIIRASIMPPLAISRRNNDQLLSVSQYRQRISLLNTSSVRIVFVDSQFQISSRSIEWECRAEQNKQCQSTSRKFISRPTVRCRSLLWSIAYGWCLVDSNAVCQRKTGNARSSTKVRDYRSHSYYDEPKGDLCRLSTKSPHQLTKFIPYLIAPMILLVAVGIAAALLGTVFNHSSTSTSETSTVVVERILSTSRFSNIQNDDYNDNNHYKWVPSLQSDWILTFLFALAYTSASQCPLK